MIRDHLASLPADLLDPLLTGSTGGLHLLRLARAALDAGLTETAGGMLLAAWEHDPLNGQAASHALAVSGQAAHPDVSALWRTLDKAAPASRRPPADPARRLEQLARSIPKRPGDLSAWREFIDLAPYSGTSSLCLDLLRAHWPEDLAALAAPLALRLHLVRGDADGAAETARQPGPWRGFPLFEQAAAHALLLTGRRDEVLSRLAGLVRAHPWNTQAVLKLHDLLGQEDRQRAPLDGTCGVLLFSCNKADDLRATLGSLAESEAASLPVRVLDNGSTDGTRDMLDGFAASGRLPGLSPLHLPVNIGAPAARDWLLSLPEVRDLDYVAFLDDDVDLPPDWLSRLGAAVAAYPGASVWGCKVAEFDRPGLAQAADLTLLPGEGEAPFAVSDLHLQGPDLGRFQYLRPCISVMGCCHLFRTADLIASGGFDIRFSPTQFDDLDRDLSAALAGKPAVYQGFLPVAHRKRSGGQVRDEAAGGNARGNQTKLFAKHGPRAGELFHSQRRWLADDLLGKAARLDEDFPG